MGAPLEVPGVTGTSAQMPPPGAFGTDLRASYPSYPGQTPYPAHASHPSYPPGAMNPSQPGGQTWLGAMPPGATGPGFHAPTGAPITTSAPRAPGASSSSNGGLIAGLIIGGIVVLGGAGYGISRVLGAKTTDKSSASCDGRDVDACETACSNAREKDDGDAPKICTSYGRALLAKGKGDKAVGVLQKVSDDKPGPVCDELGAVYAFSSQTLHDTKKATTLFQRACDTHVNTGCAHIGVAKELGWLDGGAKEALVLYDKACEAGDGPACMYQAAALAAGRGGKLDPTKAASLRTKAKGDLESRCKDGNAEACSLGGVASGARERRRCRSSELQSRLRRGRSPRVQQPRADGRGRRRRHTEPQRRAHDVQRSLQQGRREFL